MKYEYLSDYLLDVLRKKGEIILKIRRVERKYNTIWGEKFVEEFDLIIDNFVVEDVGLEIFDDIEIERGDKPWNLSHSN